MYNLDKASEYTFRNIDRYVVLTSDDREKIRNRFGYESTVINNPNTFKTDRRASLEKKNFLAAGRFVELKGYDRLLEAFGKFCQENKDWNLYLVGEGPQKERYLSLINEYGLIDRVIMPGRTNEIEEYYLDSSVYMMTSWWEGWGMTVTEAMQYGLPVISFDIPSVREIFGEEDCGIIVEMNNVDQLADAMKQLVDDPERMKKLGENAVKQVARFDKEAVCQKWLEILK
jgi:glycosyltransferase involved in cell wall biosynthesis